MSLQFHIFLVICLIGSSELVLAQVPVHLKTSSQIGRGVLKPRYGECYAITPLHVVAGEAGSIKLTTGESLTLVGSFKSELDSEIGLVYIEPNKFLSCQDWKFDEDLDSLFPTITNGVLEIAMEDGSQELLKVNVVKRENGYLHVQPADVNKQLIQSMSGSSLVVQNNHKTLFAGQLTEIELDGTGIVIYASKIRKTLDDFFSRDYLVKVVVEVIDDDKKTNWELTQHAVAILNENVTNKQFITRGSSTESNKFVQWKISVQNSRDFENLIEKSIYKFKTVLSVEIIDQNRTTRKIYRGGAIDYDYDTALLNSFIGAAGQIR